MTDSHDGTYGEQGAYTDPVFSEKKVKKSRRGGHARNWKKGPWGDSGPGAWWWDHRTKQPRGHVTGLYVKKAECRPEMQVAPPDHFIDAHGYQAPPASMSGKPKKSIRDSIQVGFDNDPIYAEPAPTPEPVAPRPPPARREVQAPRRPHVQTPTSCSSPSCSTAHKVVESTPYSIPAPGQATQYVPPSEGGPEIQNYGADAQSYASGATQVPLGLSLPGCSESDCPFCNSDGAKVCPTTGKKYYPISDETIQLQVSLATTGIAQLASVMTNGEVSAAELELSDTQLSQLSAAWGAVAKKRLSHVQAMGKFDDLIGLASALAMAYIPKVVGISDNIKRREAAAANVAAQDQVLADAPPPKRDELIEEESDLDDSGGVSGGPGMYHMGGNPGDGVMT